MYLEGIATLGTQPRDPIRPVVFMHRKPDVTIGASRPATSSRLRTPLPAQRRRHWRRRLRKPAWNVTIGRPMTEGARTWAPGSNEAAFAAPFARIKEYFR